MTYQLYKDQTACDSDEWGPPAGEYPTLFHAMRAAPGVPLSCWKTDPHCPDEVFTETTPQWSILGPGAAAEAQAMRTPPARRNCPPWCERDHSADGAPDLLPAQHFGGAIPGVYFSDRAVSDAVYVYAHRAGDGDSDVMVRGRIHGGDLGANPSATLTRAQAAAAVAGLIEMLAAAGPETHREVAAAIRRAIAIIEEETAR